VVAQVRAAPSQAEAATVTEGPYPNEKEDVNPETLQMQVLESLGVHRCTFPKGLST